MRRIYMDNGATSFPKAPGVGQSMKHYIEDIGCSINRSGYNSSLSADEVVYETREKIARLFNFNRPENVVFTMNVTQSMNFLLKGLLKPGDHCLVSSIEHNAIMRPLMQLKTIGVDFSRIPCDQYGRLNPKDLSNHIKPNTKVLVMNHASNVSGTVLPVADVGRICRQRDIAFIIDSAQTAGVLDVDMEQISADAIAFTGHKGLLGPQGIGGFVITDRLAKDMDSLISGGTGSLSEYEEQPPYMPDKFEAGTPNIPGIFGLNTALDYINSIGLCRIREKEMALTSIFLDGLKDMQGVKLIGLPSVDCRTVIDQHTMADGCSSTGCRTAFTKIDCRTAVISVDFPGRDNAMVAYSLDKDYGIKTRCGLHCAPSAHRTLGTFPRGTVRFSLGYFNTEQEVVYALDAIKSLLKTG